MSRSVTQPLFRNAICAVDPRDPYSSVLYDAAGLAFPNGRVTVLSALAQPPHDPDAAAAAQGLMERFAAATLPRFLPYTRNVSCVLKVGAPVTVIQQHADEVGADLVCMRVTSHITVGGRALGSVTRELLKISRVPVLVVPRADTEIVSLEPSGPVFHLGRIVVPVDPAQINSSQLAFVERLRHAWKGPTELLHVRTPHKATASENVTRMLTAVGGNASYREVERDGSVAASLLKVLDDGDVGLVILGLEQRGKRMQPGSIAYELVTHSQAVVLAVPATSSCPRT